MSFIHDIYEFRKSFRHIEKFTLRCVHLKNAVEYIFILYIDLYIVFQCIISIYCVISCRYKLVYTYILGDRLLFLYYIFREKKTCDI